METDKPGFLEFQNASENSAPKTVYFPQVAGRNLLREIVNLPQDFEGKPTIVLVAFWQWHQQQVDSWIPTIEQLRDRLPSLDYCELPVISDRNGLWKLFINEGMRAGIPEPATRKRTITLYLDKAAFRQDLSLPDEENIYILLVDEQNAVRWQGRGWFSAKQAAELTNTISSLYQSDQ